MSIAPEIARLKACAVVPVVVIDEAEIAVPLAEALLAGGIDVIEITLRRPAAMAALEVVAKKVPGILPVADGDRLVGMITDRDICVRGIALGKGPDAKVADLVAMPGAPASASALPLGRADHRVHRRGISRWLHRRTGIGRSDPQAVRDCRGCRHQQFRTRAPY